MKKRVLTLLLVLTLAISLAAPALAAAQPVTPAAPSWMDQEDYLVIPNDEVYLPENWKKVLELRAEAESGAITSDVSGGAWNYGYGSAGYRYEVGLVWLKCAENAGLTATREGRHAFYAAGRAFAAASSSWLDIVKEKDTLYYQITLCESRAYLLFQYGYGCWPSTMVNTFSCLDMTLEDFYDAPHMELVPPESRFLLSEDINEYLSQKGLPVPVSSDGNIQVFLDGGYIRLDVPPEIINNRTMIPIRAVAEALGAVVEWNPDTRQATMTRAGTSVVMTIDSTSASVNGTPISMDVAPCITGDRTLVPARYVSEFFGQKVDWDPDTRRAYITEDKSVAGDSNIEAWAVPMGMILGYYNSGDPSKFGFGRSAEHAQEFREVLGNRSWGIESREDLIGTIQRMTVYGHNITFLQEASFAMGLSDKEMADLVADSNDMGKYMWPYVKALGEKWGERGIITWDLFRMASLAQMGYTAGYLTYEEALTLIQPSAEILSANFSTWDEAYQNYMDGYAWWSRTNIEEWRKDNNKNLKEYQAMEGWEDWMWMPRGETYCFLKNDAKTKACFNDTLFTAGVIALPTREAAG